MEQGYTKAMAEHRIYSGGLSIYTTMDREIQEVMEEVYITRHEEFFPVQDVGTIPLQSSMVILDPKNNNVLGIVGGRGEKTTARGFCRASVARRQPGSSIKPVSVYGPALEIGLIDWGTPLNDLPFAVINGRDWPSNTVTGGYTAATSLSTAVTVSKNAAAVRVLDKLTPEYAFRFMNQELNVKSIVDREVTASGEVFSDIGLGQLALGGLTHGITNLELTAAFGMFTNDGIFTKPRSFTRVLDPRGNVLINNTPKRNVVMSAENAYIMTRLMQGVVDNPGGTARGGLGMRNRIQVAGKTGTTDSEKDLWFIGYTPYYLCGIWFGYDNPTFIGRRGGNPHLTLFNSVMDYIHEPIYSDPLSFVQPDTVIQARYCTRSGLAPVTGANCNPAMGLYAKGFEPTQPCTCRNPDEEEEDEDEEDESEDEDVEPETEPPPETTRADNPDESENNNIEIEITTVPPPESTAEPEPVTEEPTIPAETVPEEATEERIEEIIETEPQAELPPEITDDDNLVTAE